MLGEDPWVETGISPDEVVVQTGHPWVKWLVLASIAWVLLKK